jgi:type I restriction enzyme M protein
VKKTLLDDFDLFMVVSLPPGTFAPYSDVKAGLLFFQRPGPTKEVLYYELPLTEGLKKFSKGSPIADEHFAEACQTWERWTAYRHGLASQPESTQTSWIETAETLAKRGYDLSPKNPRRLETEKLPYPAELTAMLLGIA